MVPLEILVGMDSAWKKDVFSGPSPVFCGGIFTSTGATAPALAGAATWWEDTEIFTTANHSPDVAYHVA